MCPNHPKFTMVPQRILWDSVRCTYGGREGHTRITVEHKTVSDSNATVSDSIATVSSHRMHMHLHVSKPSQVFYNSRYTSKNTMGFCIRTHAYTCVQAVYPIPSACAITIIHECIYNGLYYPCCLSKINILTW